MALQGAIPVQFDLPGVGYVRLDSDPDPVRLRIAWVADEDIAATCDRCGPPASALDPAPALAVAHA